MCGQRGGDGDGRQDAHDRGQDQHQTHHHTLKYKDGMRTSVRLTMNKYPLPLTTCLYYENSLIHGGAVVVFTYLQHLSGCTKQLVFPRSYITKRKIGHSVHRLGNPPSEGPKLVIITHSCPETTGQLPPVGKCLISHTNK